MTAFKLYRQANKTFKKTGQGKIARVYGASRSEFAAVVIRANPCWPGLVDHAQIKYIGETRADIA